MIEQACHTKIKKNLKKFPTIRYFLEDWIFREVKSGRFSHELIILLSKDEPDWCKVKALLDQLKNVSNADDYAAIDLKLRFLLDDYCMLYHLEKYLKTLKNEKRIRRVLNVLKNDFWGGFVQLEVSYLFKKSFDEVELEPGIGDLKILVEDEEIYVEVTACRKGQKFRDVVENAKTTIIEGFEIKTFEVPPSTPRIIDVLFRKLKKPIREQKVNSIIVINVERSELDAEDFIDALLGTEVYRIYINKEKRKEWGGWVRRNDSILKNFPEFSTIGAVVIYRYDRICNTLNATILVNSLNEYIIPFIAKVFRINHTSVS